MKDAPNHILMNMIGSAQTSHKILEDSDIVIFPVSLITPKALRYNCSLLGSYYPPSACRLIQSLYDCTFSASMRQHDMMRHKSCATMWLILCLRLKGIWAATSNHGGASHMELIPRGCCRGRVCGVYQ